MRTLCLSAVLAACSALGAEQGPFQRPAIPSFALGDLDSSVRGRIPDKEAALLILHDLLGLAPYLPRPRPHPDLPDRLPPAP